MPAPGQPDPRWLRIAAIPAMLAIGAMVAIQSQINGELATRLGGGATGGVVTALVSFGVGLVLLSVLVTVSRPARRGLVAVRAAVRAGGLHPWQLAGGTAGAFLVVTQGVTVATIGVALFTVAVVGGQTGSGLAVDHHGFGPSGPQALSMLRVLGAATTVGAVAVSASERMGGADELSAAALSLALLPLVAGAGMAWQQAVNGQVSMMGGPLAAAWVNFAVGTTWLVLATVAATVVSGPPQSLPTDWWLYLGGPIGAVFIAAAAVLVRVHGVLILGLTTVCGQVTAALAVDQVVNSGALGALTVAGALITLLGVALAGLGNRRGRR
jgi:bacterial/archaeal transporter family-2 protein